MSFVVNISSHWYKKCNTYNVYIVHETLHVLKLSCHSNRRHLVQTAHVSSRPFTYGGQGRDPHVASTGWNKLPLSLLLLPLQGRRHNSKTGGA